MIENCMQCGRCTASCPAAEQMDLLPHAWVSRARMGDLTAVRDSASIWRCLACFCCAARCPRGVKPIEIAEMARSHVLRTVHSSNNTEHEISVPEGSPHNPMPQQLLVAALRKKR